MLGNLSNSSEGNQTLRPVEKVFTALRLTSCG